MKTMYQCVLKSGNRKIVTWLSDEKPFKAGDFVTLKTHDDPAMLWEVITKGEASTSAEIKQTWKCLDMPRRRGK